jgi:hypothetical protein
MIPLATTTISVRRPDTSGTVEAFEPETLALVASGVRANIGTVRGGDESVGRDLAIVEATLTCDPVEMANHDVVVDERTSQVWEVLWVQGRTGLGLNHTAAGLRRTEGA